MICDIWDIIINFVFNKVEETFQSYKLDWSSVVPSVVLYSVSFGIISLGQIIPRLEMYSRGTQKCLPNEQIVVSYISTVSDRFLISQSNIAPASVQIMLHVGSNLQRTDTINV